MVSEEFGDAFDDDEVQSTSGPSHDKPEPELVYSSAVEFFAELLARSYVREVNEGAAFAWCPEWLLGIGDEIPCGPLFNDLTVRHEYDPVCDVAGEVHFVSDDDHGHLRLGEVLHHF